MEIVKAEIRHIDEVARLFDLYRQFYQCAPDLNLAKQFIGDRISQNESTIFLACEKDIGCGFVQLYPSFCSVDAVKIYILYDLYVDIDCRRAGLAEQLMRYTTAWAKDQGAGRIDLLTAKSNDTAQALYEKLGYQITLEDYYAYSLDLS